MVDHTRFDSGQRDGIRLCVPFACSYGFKNVGPLYLRLRIHAAFHLQFLDLLDESIEWAMLCSNVDSRYEDMP